MAAKIRPLVAGNWKMNGVMAALSEAKTVAASINATGCDVIICPPATLIAPMATALAATAVAVGGQDCHAKASGAHTGDLSAAMLKDAGALAVILGHSERRADHGETSANVRAKVQAAHAAGLVAIVCIGETAGERLYGLTLKTVARQLQDSLPDAVASASTVIAYEPVWAIGTGVTPTVQDVADVHAAIRAGLVARYAGEGQNMRILYGGSVKPSNAGELLRIANVNGALVGGASLKASDFLDIIHAPAGQP